jgi:hypothetical protein
MVMKEQDNHFRNFILIAIIIVIVSIAFPFVINHFFCDWSASGTFGDTFGALNAMFSGIALAGLIITILIQRKELENQRNELALQRTEMQETRKEFLINRITDIIYSQLERYEKALDQFTITHEGKEYIGYAAIFFLDSSKQIVYYPMDDDRTQLEILNEIKSKNCHAMRLYSANNISIAQFSLSAYNSTKVVEEILYKCDLSTEEIDDLKNLFFRNLGFIQLGILEDISQKFAEYIKLSTSDNNYTLECNIEYGRLTTAHIFLSSIIKFRETVITTEVIEEKRKNWPDEFGAYA